MGACKTFRNGQIYNEKLWVLEVPMELVRMEMSDYSILCLDEAAFDHSPILFDRGGLRWGKTPFRSKTFGSKWKAQDIGEYDIHPNPTSLSLQDLGSQCISYSPTQETFSRICGWGRTSKAFIFWIPN